MGWVLFNEGLILVGLIALEFQSRHGQPSEIVWLPLFGGINGSQSG